MGESKRRKEALGEDYGKETRLYSWFPFTKSQTQQFMQWTTKGAWAGIILLIGGWAVIRFLGPALGWWEVN